MRLCQAEGLFRIHAQAGGGGGLHCGAGVGAGYDISFYMQPTATSIFAAQAGGSGGLHRAAGAARSIIVRQRKQC